MKILLVNDTIIKFGGAEEHCYSLKKLLEDKGHKVKIFGKGTFETIPTYVLRFFDPFVYFQTLKLIKNFNPDIVHVHGVTRNISPAPIVAAKKLGKNVVMTIHDFHLYCPKTWAIQHSGKPCPGFSIRCVWRCQGREEGIQYFPYHLLKWLKVGFHRLLIKKYVDLFITPSNKLKELMQYSLNIPEEKIVYLPNFSSLGRNTRRNVSKIKSNQFLYVGRLSKEKGVNVLIGAIHLLVIRNKLNVKLIIIGDGPEREKLERLSQLLGLEKNVDFLGRLPRPSLLKYYLESLALIIPSVCMDNSPLVAYEAMGYGTPIIASNIGGLPDLVQDNKNGFLFEMGNKNILAYYLQRLYENTKLSITLGDRGYEMAKKRFNKQQYYEKLIKIYRNT